MTRGIGVCLFALILALPLPIAARQSRAETIGQQQAEKAANSHPYEPPKAERIFLAVKKELIDAPDGVYPLFGSVYPGGGLALGGGYRRYFGDRTFWDAKGLWSIRNYKLAELSAESPGHSLGRFDLVARLGWRDAASVAKYDMTDPSGKSEPTRFQLQQIYAGGGVKARPVPWLVLGTQLHYEDYTVKEDPLEPADAGADSTYYRTTASAGVDWRPSEGYARRGGLYELRYHDYKSRSEISGFERLEAEVVQHFPIFRETWVISLHGLADTLFDDARTAPLFLYPSLGGGSSLRGYPSWRFRDRNSLLLQGELRWIPNRYGIDMALFYDAGKVTPDRNMLNLKHLTHDVGAEIRLHGPAQTPVRFGIARGGFGWNLVFSGGAAF